MPPLPLPIILNTNFRPYTIIPLLSKLQAREVWPLWGTVHVCWAGIVGKNSLVQQFSWASKLDMTGPVSLVHHWCPRWYEWAFVYNSSGKSLSADKWGPERRQRPGPKQRTKSRIINTTTTTTNAMGIKWKGTWVWSLLSTLPYLPLSSSPSFSLFLSLLLLCWCLCRHFL